MLKAIMKTFSLICLIPERKDLIRSLKRCFNSRLRSAAKKSLVCKCMKKKLIITFYIVFWTRGALLDCNGVEIDNRILMDLGSVTVYV